MAAAIHSRPRLADPLKIERSKHSRLLSTAAAVDCINRTILDMIGHSHIPPQRAAALEN
jgi:hypothetical protein